MLYEEVFSLLKDEISQRDYNRYIKNLKFLEKSSKTDNIVFQTHSPIIAKWVKTKYSKLISHYFEVLTGIKPQITIQTSSKVSTQHKTQTTQETNEYIEKNKVVLNPSYTFDSFVLGSSNQMAFALCQSISKKPAKEYNPLFMYGMSGLGKTHLLQAIGSEAIKHGQKVIYTTSEQFMNDFTHNLRNKTPDRFRQKYRECDYLLIDDIQFLNGKEQTQEEFFHTFNELHTNNKQIVLTSDKPPKKIAGFEDRLKSRFEWGMLVNIQPPGLETKISIIEIKCELNGITIDRDIINYIAVSMGDNVREIESAITSIYSYSTLMNQEITLEFVQNILKDQIKTKQESITLENIVKVISLELNIKPSDIKSKKRNKPIVEARRIVIYLARKLTPNSTPALASYFNMKDHTAISHNIKRINQLLDEDENFRIKVDELKNKISTFS